MPFKPKYDTTFVHVQMCMMAWQGHTSFEVREHEKERGEQSEFCHPIERNYIPLSTFNKAIYPVVSTP